MSDVSGRSPFMVGISAGPAQIEEPGNSHWTPALVLRPRGNGGVASVIDAVTPFLPSAQVLPVSARRPADLWRVLRAARRRPVVHLNPSLRGRAILRDGALHRLVRALGCPTLVAWHGVDRRMLRRLDGGTMRRLFGDAGRTWVLVPELADALRRIGLSDVQLVRNPAPHAALPRDPEPRRILFLGRLEEAKGAPAMAVALSLLRRRHPEATLALAGAGPVDLRGPGIERLGWIGAARREAELARASVLVLPTRDDAAPMVVLEALAAGVPVVATRVGAIPDMVGPHGVLLDQADPASIVRAVEAVWHEPPPRARHLETAPMVAARWAAAWEEIACAAG